MTYTKVANEVILQMTLDDYEQLLQLMGIAIGAMSADKPFFRHAIGFVNQLNRTNPNFTPYEFPEQSEVKQ